VDENYAGVTLAALAELPRNRPVALLMRHSLRAPILTSAEVYVSDLTSEGIAIARDFGERLAQFRCLGRLVSSPVSRCVNTAVAIAAGAGGGNLVSIDDRLSHPFMLPVWQGSPVFEPRKKVPFEIRAILNLMAGESSSGARVDLFVSHDTVVEALAGYAFGLVTRSNGNVPNYLEAVFVWLDGRDMCLSWRGKTKRFRKGIFMEDTIA